MMNHQAALNRLWTQVMLEELYRKGVRHLCIAPGSRSTPLTLEAVAHGGFTLHHHFDERGLGFLALGIAKATQHAVAVVVTSGTAVANLLPAVAESMLTKERLILLTSDRPLELLECGANQAIVQTGIFSNHVSKAVALPSPSTEVSLNWLLTTIDHAMEYQHQHGGSLHINCPFPEPLYGGEDKSIFEDYCRSIQSWWQGNKAYVAYGSSPIHDHLATMPSLDLVSKKGVIIVGNVDLRTANKAKAFAKQLGWPILFDPQSGQSSDWQHYDLWLQNMDAKQRLSECEVVLQVGARFVSKRLNQWLAKQVNAGTQCILLTEYCDRLNPDHLPIMHLNVDVKSWLDAAILTFTTSNFYGWARDLKPYAQAMSMRLSPCDTLSEFDVARSVQALPEGTRVFLGNSLIVRLVDMVSSMQGLETFSNRGASGIDGLVATASGITRVDDSSLVLYLGDTSLLYDLNSLALLTNETQPNVIVVTNNDGGAIFDLLPVPAEQKSACYQMPHGYQFKHAAAQFNLAYSHPKSKSELESTLTSHLANGSGTLLIEVITPSDEVGHIIRELSQQAMSHNVPEGVSRPSASKMTPP